MCVAEQPPLRYICSCRHWSVGLILLAHSLCRHTTSTGGRGQSRSWPSADRQAPSCATRHSKVQNLSDFTVSRRKGRRRKMDDLWLSCSCITVSHFRFHKHLVFPLSCFLCSLVSTMRTGGVFCLWSVIYGGEMCDKSFTVHQSISLNNKQRRSKVKDTLPSLGATQICPPQLGWDSETVILFGSAQLCWLHCLP